VRGFFIALTFLTRLKIGSKQPVSTEDFSKATYYFPLIGFFIGLILSLTAVLGRVILEPPTIAGIIVILEVVLTGGIHLDGLSDTCDGIFAGKKRDKILEIMKDSHVGAMGVIGLFSVLFLKWLFLAEILGWPQQLFSVQLFVLILMPLLGRWAMTCVVFLYPSAREEGLGRLFKKNLNKTGFSLVSIYCLDIILILILLFARFSTQHVLIEQLLLISMVLLVTFSTVFIMANRLNQLLGGHTGDTYGTINEGTELVFLGCCLLFSGILNQFNL
jgi:adenosylcobinamide-GDP ribazoletransferase